MEPGVWICPGMMPILHFPGEIIPGVFGPIIWQFFSLRSRLTLIMSKVGIPSVMHTTRFTPAAAASMTASAAKRGGTKMAAAFARS